MGVVTVLVVGAIVGGRARPRPATFALDRQRKLNVMDLGTGRTYPVQSRGQLVNTPFGDGLQQGSTDCNQPPGASERWCIVRRDLIGELSVYNPGTQQRRHVAKSTHNFTTAWASGADGNWLLYDMPQPNAADINAYHLEADASRTLITLSAGYRLVPSPDGRWLAMPTTDGDLLLFDLVNGGDVVNLAAELPPDAPVSIISGYTTVDWSQDSGTVFVQAGSQPSNLYRLRVPDGQPQPITQLEQAAIFGFDVSADGKWAAFVALQDGAFYIYAVPADGSRPARVVRRAGSLRQVLFTGASVRP